MDNINITVNETIDNIVINPSISTDTIDVNITATTDEVNIDVTPNLTTININTITGNGLVTSVNGEIGDVVLTIPTNTSDLTNDGADGINPFITLNDIPPVTGYVPYTGATQDVNLGEFGIQLGNLEFDNTPTNIPTGAGAVVWNDSDGTLNLTLKGGNVTLQIGQEQVLRVVNKTATNVNLLESNYQAVRVTGAQGQRLKVDLAQATNDTLSSETIGLVTETINNNQEGFITTSGLVRGINTTGSLQGETWADGDILYLSPTTAGNITKIKPVAPNHLVIIGYVVHSHITQGTIFVKVDSGYELDELHNVKITTPLNNNILGYNSTSNIWENKTIIDALGYTPYNATNPNGYTSNLGTVTSVSALTLGTTGTDLSSTVANGTTTPVITLNVPTASATNRGALSTTDWIAFNGKFTLPSLTNGSVLFSNGTTITQDNSNFFWDNTNKRLNLGGITSNTARLGIKAPGALSTDIALRIRNSADTSDILTVGGTNILAIDAVNGNGKIQFAPGTGITNTAGGGLNIGQVFGAGGGGYYIKFWEQSNTVNYAKFTQTNVCISSTNIITTEASSQFQVDTTTKGFLPPRMTTTQKNAIATPASGLVVYDTTLGKLCVRGAAAWETITSI